MESHSLLQGIFLTLGSNVFLLHWMQILYRLSPVQKKVLKPSTSYHVQYQQDTLMPYSLVLSTKREFNVSAGINRRACQFKEPVLTSNPKSASSLTSYIIMDKLFSFHKVNFHV